MHTMHTPGPWTVDSDDGIDFTILGGKTSQVRIAVEASERDARLIAAAPAMLAALEACVCAMQDYQAGIGITEMFDKGERMGRAAIAQATGDAR